MREPVWSEASSHNASRASRSAPRARTEALRSQSRRSRATWSLRLRPAWRLRPTSPMREVSSASTKEWMSSAVGSTTRLPSSAPTARAARPRPSSAAISAGRMPACPSMAAWAIEPSRSSGRRRWSTEVEERNASIAGSSPVPVPPFEVSHSLAIRSLLTH